MLHDLICFNNKTLLLVIPSVARKQPKAARLECVIDRPTVISTEALRSNA